MHEALNTVEKITNYIGPIWGSCWGLLLLHEAPKAKSSPKRGLLLLEAKAEKAHFTLAIEKLLSRSFPSFCGRTVPSFFPRFFSSLRILISSPKQIWLKQLLREASGAFPSRTFGEA